MKLNWGNNNRWILVLNYKNRIFYKGLCVGDGLLLYVFKFICNVICYCMCLFFLDVSVFDFIFGFVKKIR